VLVYPSGLDLSSSHLRFLTARIREHRCAIGSRWRRLSAGRQALLAADRPFYSGKHKKHGMNVQVLADPAGRLLWASPALPGAVHDIRAAREHGILDALTSANLDCWADKDYRGAGLAARVPYRGRWDNLSEGQQAVNRSQAKIRALVEPAVAILKTWRLLRKLRCSTTRITSLVQAVLTLHLTCSN